MSRHPITTGPGHAVPPKREESSMRETLQNRAALALGAINAWQTETARLGQWADNTDAAMDAARDVLVDITRPIRQRSFAPGTLNAGGYLREGYAGSIIDHELWAIREIAGEAVSSIREETGTWEVAQQIRLYEAIAANAMNIVRFMSEER